MSTFDKRLSLVLLALSAVTVISWWIGTRTAAAELNASITFGVILIAAVKIRIIIREFMEARHAPRWLRWGTDAWLAILLVTLLATYSLMQ